ncbi:MAG: hypothetical protein O7C74_01130 [Acidobacteria bacterium]|nr:hypothetical protein [Acidobacteriota bacterium]
MENRYRGLRVIAFMWLAWLLAQALLALTLRVEGYDGYWYLSNAWYLAGGPVFQYEVTKAPLVSLLVLPLAVLRRMGLPEVAVFAGSHLVMLLLTTALGVAVMRLLRPRFGTTLAWAGAFAFLGSRLVSRYAVFAMSDLAAAAGVLLALLALERGQARDGWRARLPFVAAVTMAILARYPAGLVLPVGILWDLLVTVTAGDRGIRKTLRRGLDHAVAAALAGLALVLVHLAIYMVPFRSPAGALAALSDMIQRNARLGGISIRGLEPWWEYGPMLILACTLPAVLLIGWGMITALRAGGRREGLHALWLAVYLAFVSLVSSHKEARYILPALPSLFLFLLWGVRAAGQPAPLRRLPARRLLAIGFLLALGLVGTVREGTVLAQPFFRRPLQAQLAAAMNEEAPAPARLAWVGNFYPLVPPRHIFSRSDEYYYVYHLAPHVIEYYLGRKVISLRDLQAEELDGVLYPLGVGARLGTGDAVIASVTDVTLTATLPDTSPPLTFSLLDVWKLEATSAQGGGRLLRAPGDPVSIRIIGTEMQVTTPPGVMEVVIRRRSGLSVSLGVQQVLKGRVALELPPEWHADQVNTAQVVRFTPRPLKLSW